MLPELGRLSYLVIATWSLMIDDRLKDLDECRLYKYRLQCEIVNTATSPNMATVKYHDTCSFRKVDRAIFFALILAAAAAAAAAAPLKGLSWLAAIGGVERLAWDDIVKNGKSRFVETGMGIQANVYSCPGVILRLLFLECDYVVRISAFCIWIMLDGVSKSQWSFPTKLYPQSVPNSVANHISYDQSG